MTIRRSLNPADLSGRLSLVEDALSATTTATLITVRSARALIGEKCEELIKEVRALKLEAPACDPIREVESVMYGYIADANPDVFAQAERYGMTSDATARSVDRAFQSAKTAPRSGAELYARYQAALLERGVGCDDWAELSPHDREAWNQIAD